MLIMLPNPWYSITAGIASNSKDFNAGGNQSCGRRGRSRPSRRGDLSVRAEDATLLVGVLLTMASAVYLQVMLETTFNGRHVRLELVADGNHSGGARSTSEVAPRTYAKCSRDL